MADLKLTELTALAATPADLDELYIVDDPAGTPLSKKVTRANLVDQDHGEIYLHGGVTPQVISVGGTFEKFTGFASDGLARGAVNASGSDKITLTNTGIYLINFHASFSGTNNATATFRAYWNGMLHDRLEFLRKIGTGGDTGSASFMGLLDASAAGKDLEIWFTLDGSGNNVVCQHCDLTAIRIAGT